MLPAPQNGESLCIGGDTKLGRQSIAARKSKVTVISQDTVMMLALYPGESEIIQKEKKLYPYETIWI